jgi:hypothetical protein
MARDRERTVPMYIPDIYQNDRDEKLNQKSSRSRSPSRSRAKNETFTILYFYYC